MADDKNIIRSTDTNLKITERHLTRKNQRQPAQREPFFDEQIYPFREAGFTPTPQVGVQTIPLSSTDQIYQAGLNHQGGDGSNLGNIIAGIGRDGGDVYRVQTDKEGLHKTHVSTLFVNDRGQFSVWIKGFNGGTASGTDEYVLSLHQFSSEATPVDEESLVILWDAGEEELRLYPDITNFPDTHFDIPIAEADWQEEAWHQIRAKWSYQDQEWSIKFDGTEGTAFEPETIPWPSWNEFTKVEVFTDLNFENDIFHDCQFLSFGQFPFDPVTGTIGISSSFDILIEKNQRNLNENVHGVLSPEATGQPLDSITPVNITKGIGRVYLVVNAGADTTGSITVTGDTVDRDTQAVTAGDTEVLAIAGTSTDNSAADVDGNIMHDITDGYLTTKWFKGVVVLSTADLDISDLDVYHSSYEQFNDASNITIDSFDINVKVINNAGWFHGYMYSMKPTSGSKADISRISTLEVLVADVNADDYNRLRDSEVDTSIDGAAGEGFWIDLFFGPDPLTYWEDFTMKIWYTETKDVATIAGSVTTPVTLDIAYDNGDTIDYSSGNGAVIMNFPAAGTTNAIVEALNTYQVRNLWLQANDADSLDVGILYYTTSADASPTDSHMMGITSTDNGSNNYLRWLITSLGLIQGTGFSVRDYPTSGNPIHTITQNTVIFNSLQSDLDFNIKSDNNANMFFIDASEDLIGINEGTPEYTFDIVGDLASESSIINTSTADSGGGLQRLFSEATSGALSGATGTIQVDVPAGSRILGVQLRVDTLITGATAWDAAYSGGLSQSINAGGSVAKNTKINKMFDSNTDTDIANAEVDIVLTPFGPNFTGGVVRAIIYFEQFITMEDNP